MAAESRARFFDHFVRRHGITGGLMHRLALRINRPTVCQHRFVRRSIVDGEADHQRRIEPAAKLVPALDVNVCRPAQLRAILQDSD